ncbi:hypothetical protein [Alistipes sp.]|uniref:hypothetical protein n=1 Tax=Alistipes sp. TaxID=1872444 RepID=UPI003A8BACFB
MDMIRSFRSESATRKGAESGSVRRDDFGAEDPLWLVSVILTAFFVFVGLSAAACVLWGVMR